MAGDARSAARRRLAEGDSRVVPLPGVRDARTARRATLLFLASWGALFAGLLAVYAVARSRAPAWPTLGEPRVAPLLPGLAAGALAAAGAGAAAALRLVRRGRAVRAARALAAAAAAGAVFLALEASTWVAAVAEGLRPSGPYGGAFLGLTGLVSLHAAAGTALLAALAAGVRRGTYNRGRHLPVELGALTWAFVAAAGVAVHAALLVP